VVIPYIVAGVLLLWSAARADSMGWFGTRPTQISNVPASVRDNPGAYRALYRGSPRSIGGK
jgi:hypothetical protein